MKNVRRDINGAFNFVNTVAADLTDQDTTWASWIDKTWDSVKNSIPVVGWMPDATAADKLYKATVNGDTGYQKRLKSAYDSTKALNSAISRGLRANDSRIREAAIAWNNNDLDEYMRIAKEIIAEGNFSQDNVVAAVRAEANSLMPGETASEPKAKSLFTVEKFVEAVAQGDSNTAEAARADLIETAQRNGKTLEEAENSFNSSAKTKLKEVYQDGKLADTGAVETLTNYCGMTQEKAEEMVAVMEFVREHPDCEGISYAAVDDYTTYCEAAGVQAKVFYKAWEYKNTLSGTVKEPMLEYIDGLNLSKAQKDSLYYAFGWAESRIHEAPWH